MILITRPEEEAKKLSQILNYERIVHHTDSLIYFSALLKDKINITSNTFLVSSVQAIYSMQKNNFFENSNVRDGSYYVIGNRSSQLLKELGMNQVQDTFTDFNMFNNYLLKNKIKSEINYLCGDIITEEAEQAVESKKLRKIILYKINATKRFNPKTIELFELKKIRSVLLYSLYTSSVFHQLIKKYEIEGKVRNLEYYCLSSRIAKYMQENDYNNVLICDQPNQESMITALKKN